jgi:hypothetical protein
VRTLDSVVMAIPLGAMLLGFTDIRPLGRVPAALLASSLCLCVANACGAGAGGAVGALTGPYFARARRRFPLTAPWRCAACARAHFGKGKEGRGWRFLAGAVFSFWQSGISVLSPPWPEIFLPFPFFFWFQMLYRGGARVYGQKREGAPGHLQGLNRPARKRAGALKRLLPVFSSIQAAYGARERSPVNLESVCVGCKNEGRCLRGNSMQAVKLFTAAMSGEISEDFKNHCERWDEMEQQIWFTRMQRECARMIGRQIKAIGDMISSVARSLSKDFTPETGLIRAVTLGLEEADGADAYRVSATREGGLLRVQVACPPAGAAASAKPSSRRWSARARVWGCSASTTGASAKAACAV